MNDDSSTAPDAPVVDDYGFNSPDELGVEMTPDAESAYVDKVLGLSPKEANDGDTGESDGKAGDSTGEAGDGKGEKTDDKTLPAPVNAPPVVKEEKPTPETAPELDTSDLWVDVQDREGKTVRITLEDGIPDDFTFKNDKALYDVMDAMREMKDLKISRENEIDKWQSEQDAKAAAAKVSEDTVTGWNQEIEDLLETGILDKPKTPPTNGQSYTPEEIAADPALQTMNGVFDFMKAENDKRLTSGKPPIKSYGLALTMYQNSEKVKADAQSKLDAEAEQKAKDELTKKRGAVVGGTSSPAGSGKGYVYKRGSAKNIWQVNTDDI